METNEAINSPEAHQQRQARAYITRTALTLAGVAMMAYGGMRAFPVLDAPRWFDHDLSVFELPAAKTYYSLRHQEYRARTLMDSLHKSSFSREAQKAYPSLAQEYAQSRGRADSLEQTDPATISALSEIQDKYLGAAINGFLFAAGISTIVLTLAGSSLKQSNLTTIAQDRSSPRYAPRGW